MTPAPTSPTPSIKEPPPTKLPQSLPGPDGTSEPDPSVDREPEKRDQETPGDDREKDGDGQDQMP